MAKSQASTATTYFLSRLFVFALLAASCAPAPSRVLTPDEKRADMYWMFSIFDQNYAPRQYKAQELGFDYDALKTDYLARALDTTDNNSFYYVMHNFVAQFRDAHTASMLQASGLPGRTQVATLAFGGARLGDNLLVTDLLPTVAANSAFPILVGDQIKKLDGVALPDIVRTEMVKTRNLGNDESNLTGLMNNIFNRTALAEELPTAPWARLTVERAGADLEISVPWIVEDLQTFLTQQQSAATDNPTTKVAGLDAKKLFDTGLGWLESGHIAVNIPFDTTPGTKFWNFFKVYDTTPTWSSKQVIDAVRAELASKQPATRLSAADLKARVALGRTVPDDAVFLEDSQTFPIYIAGYPTADGSTALYAYMYLDTFAPAGDEAVPIGELTQVVPQLGKLGVKGLIIDTIDNSGGSLTLGLHMAQLLSKMPITPPRMQLKVSETWIDQFDTLSTTAPSPAEQELARRVSDELKADRAAGKLLSDPMSGDILMPFSFALGNKDYPDGMKVVLMVNEMCASMCDMFAATLQDNRIATVLGSRTMGAGGNVVQHGQAPNSNLIIGQTESMMLRADGSAIENKGVTPDVAFNVNADIIAKYAGVKGKALEILGCTGSACSSADSAGAGADRGGGCSIGQGRTPVQALGAGLLGLALVLLALRLRRGRRARVTLGRRG